MQSSEWVRDREEFVKRYAECGGSVRAMVRKYGVARSTLARWYKKHEINPSDDGTVSRVIVSNDSASIVADNMTHKQSPEELMLHYGCHPDDWICDKISMTEWESNAGDGEKITLYRMKLHLIRKKPISFIMPATPPGKRFKRSKVVNRKGKPLLGVFVGDHQIPNQDMRLHSAFCAWQKLNKPDFGTIIGDFLDISSPSRHDPNPEWDRPIQEGIDTGYSIALDYIEAHPDCVWDMLVGNHDERIRAAILKVLKDLYGIRRALVPGQDYEEGVLTLRHLLRFDELGINVIQPLGKYTHAQRVYSDNLVARHGWLTGKNVAEKSIERLLHSLIFGHTHGMSVGAKTISNSDGSHRTVRSIENPAMCTIKKGLGYAVDADWVNGWTTVQLWDDGEFSFEQAMYDNGVVTWRDQRFDV